MNQSQIHPALRQHTVPSPQKGATSTAYAENPLPPSYSPVPASSAGNSQSATTPNYYQGGPSLQDSPNDVNQSSPNNADPNDIKRPRACEACRQLKVKCEFDDNDPGATCKRCAKARRTCIVTVPTRKRQKKTDNRVAELEKKIDALTATLAARGTVDQDHSVDPAIAKPVEPRQTAYDQWSSPSQQHGIPSRPSSESASAQFIKRKHYEGVDYFTGDVAKAAARQGSPPPVPIYSQPPKQEPPQKIVNSAPPYIDVVERDLITIESAYRCFERYCTEMSHHVPIVVFPPGTTAEDIRQTKPILFLAILSISSGTIRPDLQNKFMEEVLRQLADRVIYYGEKLIELVQAIQVLCVFYQPPEKYEELNFNQMIHIAAVMSMDLGMGKRSKPGAPANKKALNSKQPMLDLNSAEVRRCWIGIYYMSANSAMSLRRPLLVRWSKYCDECLQILATAPDALSTDRRLCQLVKAQHFAEDIGIQFSMDDPASAVLFTDNTTQRDLKVFEQNLAEWRELGGDLMESPILKHTEAIINLYMHEIAMHRNHNIDDFRPPYTATPIEGPPDPDRITPAHIESLTACLRASHNAFEAFLSMGVAMLRSVPTHFYVRTSYAAVALIKLYSAVAAKDSKFGKIFGTDELKVEEYLDRLISMLQQVAADGASRVAQKFVFIFTMLKNWHMKRTVPSGNVPPRQDNARVQSNGGQYPVYNSGAMPTMNDPSAAWSTHHRASMDADMHTRNRTGLQMLSDAAMGPGHPMQSQPPQSQWLSPSQQMSQMQTMSSLNGMNMTQPDYSMMNAPFTAMDQMAIGGFTSDDFIPFSIPDNWMDFSFQPPPGGPMW